METEKKTRKPKAKKETVDTEVAVVESKKEESTSEETVYLGICVKTGEKLYKKV